MAEPTVVAHVSQPTDAGVPAVVINLVRDQTARGWSVVVVSPDEGFLRDSIVAEGARHISWPAERAPGSRTAIETHALGRILRQVAPNLVHLHSSKAGVAGRAALRGRIPTVFQPHGWSFWAATGVTRATARQWERFAARWTDALACVSRAEHAAGLDAGISAPWVVVPNGIDLGRWHPQSSEDRAAARTRVGLDEEPVAICVGRLARQKGQDLLVSAWPLVRDRVPDARLVLVGDGPDRAALAAVAGPGVDLVGQRNDVSVWIAASDLVVLPSRWEGMSLALLEAMASARPVVATDVAGMREVLSSGGGEVVPVENAGALADAIATRLRERQILEAEGARARKTIEERHDLRAANERMAQVYADVLDRRKDAKGGRRR